VLTVDFDRLEVKAGDRFLDVGAGSGRHAFEALRRGASVVALDLTTDDLHGARDTMEAMVTSGEAVTDDGSVLVGDALRLPFPDDSIDRIVASEVLEHVDADADAIDELVRVLRPGGTMAVTVPSWLPEWVCWSISDEYHAPAVVGGHVRIYTKAELSMKLERAGLELGGSSRTHALHSPYWWLKCAVGVNDDDHPVVRPYRKLLEWDIMSQPLVTRVADQVLNPVLGKSLVLYARQPVPAEVAGAA
jgi:SAM-dependent methyltransferase